MMSSTTGIKQRFSCPDIEQLMLEKYGIKSKARELVGYIDQNFLIKSDKNKQYIVKVCFDADSISELDLQNQTMMWLKSHEQSIQVPECIANKQSKLITRVQSNGGNPAFIRVLTFLSGTFIVDLSSHSDELLFEIGSYFAKIDLCLKDFFHPAAFRYTPWDLRCGYQVISDRLELISEPEKRNVISYFLDYYLKSVAPLVNQLGSSVIHNDANDYNILVSVDGKQQVISGVIDFGDMVHTHTVNDLAIAVSYAMLYREDPLEAALHVIKGYNSISPLQETEIKVLLGLTTLRLSTSIAMSAESYSKNPDNEYLLVSQKPIWELLLKLSKLDPQEITVQFFACCHSNTSGKTYSTEEILQYRQQHLSRSLSVSYKKPLKIIRGRGQYLFDEQDGRYLDMVNNVCHVGHCHPRVVVAGQNQLAQLNTNTRYLHDNIIKYSKRLLATMPEPLSVVMFVNSGSEANELAMRMARAYTQQRDMLVVDGAYHGNTQGCVDISPYKFDGKGGNGAPEWVHKVMLPDPYRGPYTGMSLDSGCKYADHVKEVLKQLAANGKKPCAFICESLQGVAGQIVMPEGYLQAAYKSVRDVGGLCIADEVQIGFGRVGSHMWGFETQGVVPDIVTMGKPIGNGHPMAAVITTQEIAESFANGMEYFNTFGGNPVSCAIGLAVLDVINDEKLKENAEQTGNYLIEGLKSLQQQYSIIGDVRGLGLFVGAEFVLDRETLQPAPDELVKIVEAMKEKGILLSTEGRLHNVLKIKPPIVFNRDNADEFLKKLDEVLKVVC